jgi:hypothetical protein
LFDFPALFKCLAEHLCDALPSCPIASGANSGANSPAEKIDALPSPLPSALVGRTGSVLVLAAICYDRAQTA